MNIDYSNCPERFAHTLELYVEHGIAGGSFINGVLENNLFEALARYDQSGPADELRKLCTFIYNSLPSACWGSREKCISWIDQKSKERFDK